MHHYREKLIEIIKLQIRRIARTLHTSRTKDKKSMIEITPSHINRLIEIESSVQYDKAPPNGKQPFIIKNRKSPIIISAPHGARTKRDNKDEFWHEEDEYTAGIARLLGEICGVSVIAMVARSDTYDPNYYDEKKPEYKKELAEIIKADKIKYVIDLHGAAFNSNSLASTQLVDLGLGKDNDYLDEAHQEKLVSLIETQLGDNVTYRNKKPGFPAAGKGTIANFCNKLGIATVQIEMKSQVRVAHRFSTASLYKSYGAYDADPNSIIHMLQALVDFIEYLKDQTK
jgi:hypothetical protein